MAVQGAALTVAVQGATLTNCNLAGAKLKGADLTDANYDVEACVERGWLKVACCNQTAATTITQQLYDSETQQDTVRHSEIQ